MNKTDKKVYEYLLNNPPIRAIYLKNKLLISQSTLNKSLKRLKSDNKITTETIGRYIYYTVSNNYPVYQKLSTQKLNQM